MKNLKFPNTPRYNRVNQAYLNAKSESSLIELCFALLNMEETENENHEEYKIAGAVLYSEITQKSYESKIIQV